MVSHRRKYLYIVFENNYNGVGGGGGGCEFSVTRCWHKKWPNYSKS